MWGGRTFIRFPSFSGFLLMCWSVNTTQRHERRQWWFRLAMCVCVCVTVALPVFFADFGSEANPTEPADSDAQTGGQNVSVLHLSESASFSSVNKENIQQQKKERKERKNHHQQRNLFRMILIVCASRKIDVSLLSVCQILTTANNSTSQGLKQWFQGKLEGEKKVILMVIFIWGARPH